MEGTELRASIWELLDNHSPEEVARLLGVSKSTVLSQARIMAAKKPFTQNEIDTMMSETIYGKPIDGIPCFCERV